ncbi:tetratricopeptide repeat protein [Patiriisocius marinus]|uniref:Uncharacterized protein n=1 Tax=Patiriisocius marinus TaxID=1397112 RepID=A0A5J4J3G9_9FLAO|nr:tetratricopeptide repeat protein [Patiriisocius marinus]GER60420.1 hypothetical protein ULMA_25280 [Patiriisocius marinus]
MNKYFIVVLILCFARANSQKELALAVGDSLYAMGNYSSAILEFEKAPKSKIQQEKIAKSHLSLGNKIEAIVIYKNLSIQYPEALILKKNYATVLYNAEKYTEAKQVFRELAMQDMQNSNTFYYLGLIAEKQQDTTAVENFKMATYINPNHSDAIYKVAKLNVQKQRFFNAAGFIEKGLALNENSTRFLILKGLSAYYKREYEEAIETLTKVVSLGKNTEQIHAILATSYAMLFQYENAVAAYRILLSQYNDLNPSYHYNMGKCLMGLEDFENGQSYVKTAISILDVSLHDQYVTLAVSYSRQQKYQEAFSYLKLALKEDNTSEKAHYQLAVAADNFYKDDADVLELYENYMDKFGVNGRYYSLAATRSKDLRQVLFFKEGK